MRNSRNTSILVIVYRVASRFAVRIERWNSANLSTELRVTALAHTIGNKADAADKPINGATRLEKRRAMMDASALWCEPKAANVLAFAKAGGAA